MSATLTDIKTKQSYFRPEFTRWGPKQDYSGAHVLTIDGRLAEIRRQYVREFPLCVMCELFHFNGEKLGDHALTSLRILDRTAGAV